MQIGMDGAAKINIQNIDGSVINAALDGSAQLDVIMDGDLSLEVSNGIDSDIQIECDGEFGVYTKVRSGDVPDYTGATEVTPSQEMQTLLTSGRIVHKNIIINPIPSNYGLITWNGAALTVS